MKHKTLLLMAFILILFVVHQAQVGAETLAKAPVLSPSKAIYSPPTKVSVTYYELDPNYNSSTGTRCAPRAKTYGCTQWPNDKYWYYPYPSNPYSDTIETDYLPNVLAREMPANTYPNPQSQKALAVAARTFAYYKGNWTDFNNSTQFQVDIPYAFNAFYKRPADGEKPPPQGDLCNLPGLNGPQQITCDAINSTNGVYLSKNGDRIDAEHGSDSDSPTRAGGQTYLASVEDPISTICGAYDNGTSNGGMSQKGANRWELGNQCDLHGDSTTSWIVRWGDYRQILTHYYTGIDLVNRSGTPQAPNDRWNLLNFNNNTSIVMNTGATNTYSFTLQNTSTTDWNANEITVGYQWTPVNGAAQSGNWQIAGTITSPAPVTSGGPPASPWVSPPVTVTLPFTAPIAPGVYDLHLDLRRSNSNSWFSEGGYGGWPDAKVSAACVGAVCAPIILGSDDAGPNPDNGCVFDTTYNEVYFASCYTGENITSGFRFQNITIPVSATIQSARIVFTADGPYTNEIIVRFNGELNTNAPTYSASDPPSSPSRLNNLTGNYVLWFVTDAWTLGDVRTTPDLSPIIQEIVNQSGWAPGKPISIIARNATANNTTHRRVIGYERAVAEPYLHPAILVIDYYTQ